MKTFIPTEERLREVVSDAVNDVVENELPQILRRARQKEWMNSKEVQEYLGINASQLQYLRDHKDFPYSQRGRVIFYPTKEVEGWLQSNLAKKWRERREEMNDKYPLPEPSEARLN